MFPSLSDILIVWLLLLQGTVVAIKRILKDEASTIDRFIREVTLLARLRHPNVILFMGYCTAPELCIISEYMSRGSLYGILRRAEGNGLDVKLQRAVAISVARGMAYLHTRNPPILHLVSRVLSSRLHSDYIVEWRQPACLMQIAPQAANHRSWSQLHCHGLGC